MGKWKDYDLPCLVSKKHIRCLTHVVGHKLKEARATTWIAIELSPPCNWKWKKLNYELYF